jgi:hypothetical protein
MTEMPTTQNSGTPSLSLVSDRPVLSKKDADRYVDFARKQFDRCKSDRWRAERQWYTNLAFYFGKQNIQTQDAPGTSRQFRLYTPPAPYYRSRPVINLIRPLMRTEMAKLTGQKPNAYIVPSSSEDRDMYAANAGEQIWDSLFREKKVHRTLRRAVFWTCITGNGIIKSWWDESKPDYFSDLMGDICYESLTPFHLFVPDLKEVEIENQPYVIHAANRNTEQLSLSYGKDIRGGKASGDILEESFTSVMGVQQDNSTKTDTTLVLEVWIRPNQLKLLPQGGMFTVAGDQILDVYEGWPYLHDQYPFSHIRHVETGKFYGDSTIVDLVSLQREYNRTRGQIIESKNRTAKPQLAAEIGSIDPDKVTSEPGQIILYRPGFNAPQPIPLQGLPSYVLDEQERIKQDMNEISGQHEVSRGQVPPGVTAATAISYLQEQDESKLSYTFDSLEEGVEKIAYQTLSYVKQYWDTPRKVKVTGEDGSFDVMAFEGSDLRDNTDIRVEAGSSLPTSRAAKQSFIMDLMKLGFIDPNKGLEVMEIGGINKIYEQIQVDVRQAQRENLKMAQVTPELLQQNQQEQLGMYLQSPEGQQKAQQGLLMQGPDGSLLDMSGMMMNPGMGPTPVNLPLIVPVNSWDDHRTHIERHNNYRKSQAFDNLPMEAKQLFEQHVQQHVQGIMIGAQGAMPFAPGMLEAANNPETVKQLEAQAQGEAPTEENPAPPPPPGPEGMQ